jgi:hypothetical protein
MKPSNAYWLYRDNSIALRSGSRDKIIAEFEKVKRNFPKSLLAVYYDGEDGHSLITWSLGNVNSAGIAQR